MLRPVGFLLQLQFIVNEGWLPSLCDIPSFEIYNKSMYLLLSNQFVWLLFSVCSSTDLWSEGREFEPGRDIYIFFYLYTKSYKKTFYVYDKPLLILRILEQLMCFENSVLPSILVRQSAPYYHLKFKKNIFPEFIDKSIGLEKFSITCI